MKGKAYTIGYMIVIAAAFTTGVTFAKIATQEQVRLNEEARFEHVVLRVLGLTGSGDVPAKDVKELFKRKVVRQKAEDLTIYCGYADDRGEKVIGYAFPIGGMGLWGKIEGMLALNPEFDRIIGIDFTKQSETPGLGGRITEEWFKKQFIGKSISQKDTAGRYVQFVNPDIVGTPGPTEVHGITGATMTTKGIDAFLNRDIDRIRRAMGKGTQ